MSRSSVDLPEPERPSRPTISPGRSVNPTWSRTTSSSPSGFRKDLHTLLTMSSGARLSVCGLAFIDRGSRFDSTQAKLALGARIELAPEEPVHCHHDHAH